MDNLLICKECGTLLKHERKLNHKVCRVCNLNLPLEEYRTGHHRCKSCEYVKFNEWKERNIDKFRVGGQYYKYQKKNIDKE